MLGISGMYETVSHTKIAHCTSENCATFISTVVVVVVMVERWVLVMGWMVMVVMVPIMNQVLSLMVYHVSFMPQMCSFSVMPVMCFMSSLPAEPPLLSSQPALHPNSYRRSSRESVPQDKRFIRHYGGNPCNLLPYKTPEFRP